MLEVSEIQSDGPEINPHSLEIVCLPHPQGWDMGGFLLSSRLMKVVELILFPKIWETLPLRNL